MKYERMNNETKKANSMNQDPNPIELSELESLIAEAIPNMDAFTSAESAHDFRAKLKSVIPVLQNLASYAEAKGHAMQLRTEGRINDAVKFEAACDHVYKKLPDWAKTW